MTQWKRRRKLTLDSQPTKGGKMKTLICSLSLIAAMLFTGLAYADDRSKPIVWQLKYYISDTCYATAHGRVSAPSGDSTQPYTASVGMVLRTWDGDKTIETLISKNFSTLADARDWLLNIKLDFMYPRMIK
jgi:hypothetical protein